MKTNKLLCIVIALCLVIGLGVCMTACRNEQQPDPTETEPTQEAVPMRYTVQVVTKGGLPLEGVGVYVYTDETQEELVWFAKTDSEGKIIFNDVESDSFIALLTGVPEGYEFEDSYSLTGETTTIEVGGELAGEINLEEVTFRLSDQMKDFSVTTPDGTEYKLSQLLENKKADMVWAGRQFLADPDWLKKAQSGQGRIRGCLSCISGTASASPAATSSPSSRRPMRSTATRSKSWR